LFEQPRWSKWSWLNLVAGYVWLSAATSLGLFSSIPLWIVGAAFLAAGVSQLLWPGDTRINQTAAFGGIVGLLLSLPYGLALGFGAFVALALTSLAAAWGAGRAALLLEPHHEGVPVPEPTPLLSVKVALDEMILGFEQWGPTGYALDGTLERVIDEIERTHAFLGREGLLEKPDLYHPAPPDLIDPEIHAREIAGLRVDVLRFESGYAPAEGEPGRERWLGYDPCRDGWAYVLRHAGAPRPWLIATNGYRMGHARVDVGLFKRFHERDGLNVLIPVLPLHGPRRISWHSGTGFLSIDVIDTLHAEAQAMWDMRRLLSWIRGQDAPAVGAFGISLGGYTTALFTSVADGLACGIAGIPLTDIPRMLMRHALAHQMRYAIHKGYDLEHASAVLRPISPLTLRPRVPHEARLIFGGNADRLVTPDQVRDLWRHWQEPEMVWYEGSHISFDREREVWSAVDRKLRESGLQV
jgi:hypothetical protein